MTLSAAITRIQYHADLCTNVKFAPDVPPESLGALPAVYAYPIEGSASTGNFDSMDNFHIIAVDYVTPRTLLDVAQANIITFITEFPKKLALDPTLNGAVTTIQFGPGQMVYIALDAEWDATKVRIVRWRVPIKIHEKASA